MHRSLCAIALGLSLSFTTLAHAQLLGQETALALETEIEASLGTQIPEQAELHLALPQGTPDRLLRIIQLEQDLRSGQFGARIETLEGQELILRGRFEARLSIPVPNRTIAPGETTKASDFTTASLPFAAIGQYVIDDIDDLIGHEVRRTLVSGRPVQTQSVRAPRAVTRGEKLTLVYHQGPLALSAKVKALEDASLDEPVRVLNLTSNKTITAIARGDGQVEILQ